MKAISVEALRTLRVAAPIMFAQLIFANAPFINTFLASKLGPEAIAAQALVTGVFFTICGFGWGAISAVNVLVSRFFGANKPDDITDVVRVGLAMSFLLAIPCTVLMWFTPELLSAVGQPPELVDLTVTFSHALSFNIIVEFALVVYENFFIGLGMTRIVMFYSMIIIPINIFLKYSLVFGKFGLPQLGLGGIGCGVTLTSALGFFLLTLLILLMPRFKKHRIFNLSSLRWDYGREIIKIGWPVGVNFLVEISTFTIIAVFMGLLSADVLAGHQITLQFMMIIGMMTMGFGQAVTSRTGFYLGGNDNYKASLIGAGGIITGLLFNLIIAALFVLYPLGLIAIDLDMDGPETQATIKYAVQFFQFAYWFLALDSLRINATATLRAYKDTLYPLQIEFVCYILLALPLGYLLANHFAMAGRGWWIALLIGVSVSSFILIKRCRNKQVYA